MRRPAQIATVGWLRQDLVFKVFDYLYYDYPEFSGSLPISSFIFTSVFLVCSFICAVFLPLVIFFFNFCVSGLFFPGFRVEFFLPFGFCPPKFGPVVCVSFL